jgi:hypothetical protein
MASTSGGKNSAPPMKAVVATVVTLLAGCASSADSSLEGMLMGKAPRSNLSAAELADIARHPLGSAKNPVKVEGVEGEYRYLARLRCPENKPPAVERMGSAGELSPYGSIMDIYKAACDAPPAFTIFVDMYHPGHVEPTAVPGFTIVAPGAD